MDLHADVVCLLCLLLLTLADAIQFLESRTGKIGAENYTYYKLSAPGHIRIILTSISGDADIYASQTTKQPTFEDAELQSVTCGEDEITIPESSARPVWLGVYGYIFPEVSTYQMLIYRLSNDEYNLDYIPFAELTYEEIVASSEKPHVPMYNTKPAAPEEGESLVWDIFVGFLKILLDVLL